MQALLYSNQINSRLDYIIDFFSLQIFGARVIITTDKNEFKNTDAIRINYSDTSITEKEIRITPYTLLFEDGIKPQPIECFEWKGLRAFFKTDGDLPFDIFAAAFYLLSRYEEYLPHQKDEYGRFSHQSSFAFKENFLQLPLINLWIQEFIDIIKQKYSSFTIHYSSFNFIPTYDIDIAYSILHHAFFRNLGSFYKDLFTGEWKQLVERANVYGGWKKDPFDTYDWLDALHRQHELQPIYFFLLAKKRKDYDKNISPRNKAMQKLIQHHAKEYEIGIHPSWQSGDDEKLFQQEKILLEKISAERITGSRQHYIRMSFPATYRNLIREGITDDYSMGYGSINGFRASVASPFYWYDLDKEEQTSLLIHPFCYMEANSYFEQHFTAEQASNELQQYYEVVQSVNGQLITIFHNHFVTEQPQWLPWRKMYLDFLQRNF